MNGQLSRQSKQTADAQMSVVGYIVAAGVAILFLPVLPFALAAYAWSKFTSGDPAPTGNSASSPVE